MQRLRELRIAKGCTQQEIGDVLGVQKAAISKYENGSVPLPPKFINVLCGFFDVSADELLGRESSMPERFEESPKSVSDVADIPLVGKVHAGMPILADENVSDYIPLPATEAASGNFFFMEVEGDCMTGDYIPEGALVLVREQANVQNGQIAVVRIEDEVLLRRVKFSNGYLVLIPSNPKYEPIIVTGGDVQIIGRIVEVRFRM